MQTPARPDPPCGVSLECARRHPPTSGPLAQGQSSALLMRGSRVRFPHGLPTTMMPNYRCYSWTQAMSIPTDPAASRCDCGAALTQCSDCAVADYQVAHPECRTCVPFNPQRDAASRSGQAKLIRRVPEQFTTGGDKHNAAKAWLDGFDVAGQPSGSFGYCAGCYHPLDRCSHCDALSAPCGACAEKDSRLLELTARLSWLCSRDIDNTDQAAKAALLVRLAEAEQQLTVLRPGGTYAWKTRAEAAESALAALRGPYDPQPECPGPDCQMCSGEYCERHFNDPCECDTAQRHFRPSAGHEVKEP